MLGRSELEEIVWMGVQVRIIVKEGTNLASVVDRGARGSNQSLRYGIRRKEHKILFRSEKREYLEKVHLKPRHRLAKQ